MATAAASTRPDTPSLARMLPTWTPDGLLADEQAVADLAVRPALRDEREDLELALATGRSVSPPGPPAARRDGSLRRAAPPPSAARRRAAAGPRRAGAGSSSSTSTSGGSCDQRPAGQLAQLVAASVGRGAGARSRPPRAAARGRRRGRGGVRPIAPRPGPATAPPMWPRPGASAPWPRGTAARSRASARRASAQCAGSSRPVSRAWNARAVARLASGVVAPVGVLGERTRRRRPPPRRGSARRARATPRRRRSGASPAPRPTIAASTSIDVAAMRAIAAPSPRSP